MTLDQALMLLVVAVVFFLGFSLWNFVIKELRDVYGLLDCVGDVFKSDIKRFKALADLMSSQSQLQSETANEVIKLKAKLQALTANQGNGDDST